MLKIIIFSLLLLSASAACAEEGDDDHKGHGKPVVAKSAVKGSHEKDQNKEHNDDHGDKHGVHNVQDVHSEETQNNEHGDNIKHAEHDDHAEHSEKPDGFKLNDAAKKTFELKVIAYTPGKTILQKEAIYKGLNEVNLYRLRGDLFKRIDFKIVSQKPEGIMVSSTDLQSGDSIVVKGVGFIRMAEIAASGGLSDSHSH